MKTIIQTLLVALAVLASSACTTTVRTETQRFYVPVKIVNVGDDVRVRTKDGRKIDFRVTAADETKIEGKGISIRRDEIASVKTIQVKTVRTEETSAEPLAKVAKSVVLGYVVIVVVALVLIF